MVLGMTTKMVILDKRDRTSLAGLARDQDNIYQGTVDGDGVITLVPASLVPSKAIEPLLVQAGMAARPAPGRPR